MLLNPYKTRIPVIPGTRILQDSMGLSGFQIMDPVRPHRIWTLQYLFAPIPNRVLGGVRARFLDNKGFVSFCNQRDLEILLGIGKQGDWCYWTSQNYPFVGTRDWYGFCMDHDDFLDDLQDRELRLRESYPGILPVGLEIVRRFHNGYSDGDKEELLTLVRDYDINGMGPDTNLSTINRRWSSVEKRGIQWEQTEFSEWNQMA